MIRFNLNMLADIVLIYFIVLVALSVLWVNDVVGIISCISISLVIAVFIFLLARKKIEIKEDGLVIKNYLNFVLQHINLDEIKYVHINYKILGYDDRITIRVVLLDRKDVLVKIYPVIERGLQITDELKKVGVTVKTTEGKDKKI